nr:MAG TPA: hypothetical protein [Caudoviricetes sp.]
MIDGLTPCDFSRNKVYKARSYYCKQKAPTVSDQGCKILLCVCYALKPQLT